MADSISAIPQQPFLGRLAEFLRFLEKDRPEFLPSQLGVMQGISKLALPQASTIENLSYGNQPFTMPPSGTGAMIPQAKTGRKAEIADLVGMITGGVPGAGAVAGVGTKLSNEAADALVRAITRNPQATAPGVLQEAGQMAPLSRIFIGPKSSLWDTGRAAKAAEMESAGAKPADIWRETLTGRGPDKNWKQEIDISNLSVDTSKISEGQIPISQVVSQPNLLGSYPQVFDLRMARETRPGVGGSYNEPAGLVNLSVADQQQASPSVLSSLIKTDYNPRQTVAHEVQHAIQGVENWPRGGSIESANYQLGEAKRQAISGLLGPRQTYNEAFTDLVSGDRALYMHKLQKLSVADNVKPRQIFSLSDWYKYGDDYRRDVGPMPKRAGAARDQWLNGAAAHIQYKISSENPAYQALKEELSEKEARNLVARANRKIAKVADENREYVQQISKFKNLEKMSDYEKYRRLYGEAEARLAQRRIDLTEQQRKEIYPFRYQTDDEYALDVPLEELFYYNR